MIISKYTFQACLIFILYLTKPLDPRYGSLLPERREEIGVKCKRLIDLGRLKFMQANNFDCNLIQYVPLKTTLENYALTAIFKIKN